jgi:alpha-tubulin suppressor-like RCC1 family protein
MPKDDINYKFTENGIVYDFYDVFVPAENFRQPSLWNWGVNGAGQLGTNDITTRNAPVTTFAGGTTWKQISAGSFNDGSGKMGAIKTDGTLWTWGFGAEGALGNGVLANRSTPVTTFAGGTNWKQVSAGGLHMAAIKTDGSLWLWGRNNQGQLAINTTAADRNTPVTTFAGGSNWKQVSAGRSHNAAIKTDGSLWVWGEGAHGRLGNNNTANISTPVTTFAGGNDWKQVSCGYNHTAAIKTDGSLWTWGRNTLGQLGNNTYGDAQNRTTPVTTFVGGNNWKSVSAGVGDNSTTAAIKTDGSLWVWGYGRHIGINDTNDRSIPVTTFSGGNTWKQVSPGQVTVAIKTDGTLWDTQNNLFTFAQRYSGATNWKSVSSGGAAQFVIAAIQYQPDP